MIDPAVLGWTSVGLLFHHCIKEEEHDRYEESSVFGSVKYFAAG